MTEQELQEEAGILAKACQQCGLELAQQNIAILRPHADQVNAMVRKLDRLEAAMREMNQPTETPIAESDESVVHG